MDDTQSDTISRGTHMLDRGTVRNAGGASTEALTREGPLSSIDNRLQRLGSNLEEMARRLNAHADRVHGVSPASHPQPAKDELVDRPDGALRRIIQTLDNLEITLEKLVSAADRNIQLA